MLLLRESALSEFAYGYFDANDENTRYEMKKHILAISAEMLVIASNIYYFGLTAQLHAAMHRTYAIGIPPKLKKAAISLSSPSDPAL